MAFVLKDEPMADEDVAAILRDQGYTGTDAEIVKQFRSGDAWQSSLEAIVPEDGTCGCSSWADVYVIKVGKKYLESMGFGLGPDRLVIFKKEQDAVNFAYHFDGVVERAAFCESTDFDEIVNRKGAS